MQKATASPKHPIIHLQEHRLSKVHKMQQVPLVAMVSVMMLVEQKGQVMFIGAFPNWGVNARVLLEGTCNVGVSISWLMNTECSDMNFLLQNDSLLFPKIDSYPMIIGNFYK